MHREFQKAYDFARGIVERSVEGERLIAMLLGVPRQGKSLISELLLADFPSCSVQGLQVIPIVRVVTPTRPTKKAMAEAIIDALDKRRYGRYTAEQATARASFLLKSAKVRVLLFDEIQHVVELNTARSWYEVADWLKTLSDGLNLSLLLVGLPAAREILSVNHQLRDRATSPHIIYPYNWNHPADIKEFCRCLLSVSEVLAQQGYTLPSMTDLDLVWRCYAATHGRYGMVVKLFEEARHQAQKAKVKTITMQALADAFQVSVGDEGEVGNPFESDAELSDSVLVQRYVALLNESGLKAPRQKRVQKSTSGDACVDGGGQR
ncbi:transposase [Pseudomonadaceae bacterium SI-3]|nr:transposase [Pseudomonadaceae bacterium SI-3]